MDPKAKILIEGENSIIEFEDETNDLRNSQLEQDMLKKMVEESLKGNENESLKKMADNKSTNGEKLTANDEENVPILSDEKNIKFTTDEEFEGIQPGEMSLEIIGYVKSVSAPKLVGSNKQFRVLNFTLSNDENSICHMTVWSKEIENVQPKLQLNNVLKFVGVEAEKFKDLKYNQGNVNCQLVVRKNTTVEVVRSHKVLDSSGLKKQIKLISFDNLKTENGRIRIQGFVKTAFRLLNYKIKDKIITYGVGSITDGHNKVEIRVKNFADDQQLYEKGDHIEVEGELNFTKQEKIIYITTEDKNCLKIIDDEKMSFKNLLEGYNVLKKE